METTRLSDRQFFSSCVDTSLPGLDTIPSLVQADDFAAAQHVFAAYVRQHLDPDTYLAGEKQSLAASADRVRAAAEDAMHHRFVSCRVPYTFGEQIDWEFNPTYNGYKEWPWQLNRHPEWRSLAQYYLLSGDERAAAEWAAQLTSWAIQAQVPENASGYATVCWRTIEAGIRMNGWAYDIHAFLRSPSVSDEVITIFFKSIWEHGWRLRNFNTARNWLIMEMHGLARIGLLYPFLTDSAAWLEYAHTRLCEELEIQVYPDGMQNELTMGYHHVVVSNYEDVLDMYRRVGKAAPEYLEKGLSRLYDLYPKTARPDLFCPTMNDGGHLNAVHALSTALKLYPEREDYRYFASARKEGHAPAFHSIFMEYGGAAIMRSGWEPDAYWAYMDLSPFGTAHQHEDKLNVQIYALGHELIPEAGTFDYDSSEMRKYVLSTRGHNTARIDGLDQNARGRYRWDPADIGVKADASFSTQERRDVGEASFTDGYGPEYLSVRHTRRFLFLKNEPGLPPLFVSIDRFEAADGGRHSYELIWHMHDNPTLLQGNTVTNTYPDGVGITISSSDGTVSVARGVKTPVYQGWLPKYGVGDVEHYPIPTALNKGSFTGACRVVTVLAPFSGGKPAVTSVTADSDPASTTFTVRVGDADVTVEE